MRRWVPFCAVLAVFGATAPGEPLSTGQWLVHLGRDYPLTPQASLGDADASIVLLFMQGAARVEPDLAESYLWQFDMLSALDRADEARQALGEYVRRQRDDVAAYLEWVELSMAALQTAEERAGLCRSLLEQPELAKPVRSDLHRRLADFYRNRGENRQAASEAEAALGDYDLNLAARMLLDELRQEGAGAERQIEMDLARIRVSPGNVSLAIRLGDSLAGLDMNEEAMRWYRHALGLSKLLPPETIEEHLAVAMVAGRCGQGEVAREHIAKATNIAKGVLGGASAQLDAERVAELAWLFAYYDRQPAEAEKLARLALADWPESTVAGRALGAALGQLGRLDEAKAVLTPIAGTDWWAGIELARVLHAGGQKAEAVERLGVASTQPATSEQRETLSDLRRAWQVPAPASRPAPPEVKKRLEAFPWAVLDYPSNPGKYLSLSLRMPGDELPVAEPWRCRVQLKNIGSFPITLGPEMMVMPELLASINTRGDRPRSCGPSIRVSLNRAPCLMPGESIEVTTTIDIGQTRSTMIGTPQVAQEVEVLAILSPVRSVSADGHEFWAPSVGGLVAEPLRFRRSALAASAEAVKGLIGRSQGAAVKDRMVATELLAMLLAERQHLSAGRLQYAAEPIDAKAVQTAVLARAADGDWEVRARVAECLRWFVLDSKATQVATGLLRDPHWLVRGLGMRALADHYGEKFEPVLNKAAQADPDEWVQRMSRALLARRQATTQPGGGASTSPAGSVAAPGLGDSGSAWSTIALGQASAPAGRGRLADTASPRPGKAFPSAEGFGAGARGGRGGRVVYVTTLSDYHRSKGERVVPNSLRWALEQNSGPRSILFKVGGTIALKQDLVLKGEAGSFVTIAGQSAPGDGIQLINYGLTIAEGAHDVIVRHVRIRPGYTSDAEWNKNAIGIWGQDNHLVHDVMVDHCSLEWAIDENVCVWDAAEKITFQYCIFGEGSTFGHHGHDGEAGVPAGYNHSMGFVTGGRFSHNTDTYLTVHHNLFTSNELRNPLLCDNGGVTDLVNNVIYNWGSYGTSVSKDVRRGLSHSPRVNVIGNVYVRGPAYHIGEGHQGSNIRHPIALITEDPRKAVEDASIYVQDNVYVYGHYTIPAWLNPVDPMVGDWVLAGIDDPLPPAASAVPVAEVSKRRREPWPVGGVPVSIESSSTVKETVAKQAGANYPHWDAVDTRLMEELRQGGGKVGFGPSVAEHESPPQLAGGPAPVDTDGDGMPDEWERSHGLNPLAAADGPADRDGDGYTNLEEYLNSLLGEK